MMKAMVLAMAMMMAGSTAQTDMYTVKAVVYEVNEYDGVQYVGLEDTDGYLWVMEDVAMSMGDRVTLVMDSLGTEDITDDEIVTYINAH
jgi:hypothetical protein